MVRLAVVVARARSWLRHSGDGGSLGRVLIYLVLTRVTLFVVAACAIRFLPVGVQPGTEAYLGRNLSIGALIRWDAWWYISVVERGYWFDPHAQSNVAFFPLLPLLIKAVAKIIGNPVVAGLLVANGAAVGAVVALWAWVRAEVGPGAAERAVRWLAVYPFSFFLNSIYAEALFFALVTVSLTAAGRGRWRLAGLWGGLAAATRPMGVLLFPAYAFGLWRAWRAGRALRWGDAVGVLLVPAGLAAYMAYLAMAFGDPLAFWRAHEVGWDLRAAWDLEAYRRVAHALLTRGPRMDSYARLLELLRVILPVVSVWLTVAVFRRLGSVPGTYAALTVAVAILFAPESLGRELLAAVPIFAAAGWIDSGGSTGEVLRLVSFGLSGILLFAFATAHFVG